MIDLFYPISGGLLTACWGAYKDTPYEGFSLISFLRSIIVTVLYFWIIQYLVNEHSIFMMLAAVASERFTQEIWKAFFRSKQRSEIYIIPQEFHIFGKVYTNYPVKLGIGTLGLLGFLMIFYYLIPIQLDSNFEKLA